MEAQLPGFVFNPSEEELINYYLRHKILGNDDKVFAIAEIDNICNYEPWDLPRLAATLSTDTWYFFSPPDRKYRKSGNKNRLTEAGFWKVTGKKREFKSRDKSQVIGIKTILVFYRGRVRDSDWTPWTIHEYQLNPSCSNGRDYVICRLHQKASERTLNSAVDAGLHSVSQVENPDRNITFPENAASPSALQPELYYSQYHSDMYLQHTNGVVGDNTTPVSRLGSGYQQDNSIDSAIQDDQNNSASLHSSTDDSSPSESFVDINETEPVKATEDSCEMHSMQGLSSPESSESLDTADIESFNALVASIAEVAPEGSSHLVLRRLFEHASARFS